MSTTDIVRAWKNEDYMMSLNSSELSALPQNPAGNIELMYDAAAEPLRSISVSLPRSKCCSIVIECSASNCA
ncbi:MAG TPA: mersacidin/lichenicidin family type 2 lantibiotic [Candidatus Angelobacter sp.]|jgi:mersacidin/lichenicidin family type 2 lantibiotic|nr:mersacidin/lichenicidin family type 2 lantibiotic [Candidatus Angelobacter sp.]